MAVGSTLADDELDAWEAENAGDFEALLENERQEHRFYGNTDDEDSIPAGTQRSGITELFQSRPTLGYTTSLFFDNEDNENSQEANVGGGSSQPKCSASGSVRTPREKQSHKSTSNYQTSPPGFTSPTFRADQPVPLPSDWNIMHARNTNSRRRSRSNLPGPSADDLDALEHAGLGLEFDADSDPIARDKSKNRIDGEEDPLQQISPPSKRPRVHDDEALIDDDIMKDIDQHDAFMATLQPTKLPVKTSSSNPKKDPRVPAPFALHAGSAASTASSSTTSQNQLQQQDFTRPIYALPHVRATTSTGTTLFFPKRQSSHRASILSINTSDPNHHLLSKPIHKMLQDIAMETNTTNQRTHKRRSTTSKSPATQLWVDKYAPRMYVDLVGNDRIHRDVLTWVKQWDFCVFGKPVKRPFTSHGKSGFSGSGFSSDKQKDALQRPDRRILLLTGPPGTGKTTLAHVVAKHAGYNVLEINASDDRTAATLRNRIQGAIECQSVMGNRQPMCVVIDEIDGVSGSGGEDTFVKWLVKIATARGKNDTIRDKHADDDEDDVSHDTARQAKKSRKQRTQPLRRPIICICNDQYVPALRPLRLIAQVIEFKSSQLSYQSISRRLSDICEWEGLQCDARAMKTLCDMVQGDIRSALNTLQGMSGCTNKVTKDMVVGATGVGGGKDVPQSVFRVWDEMFTLQTAKSKRKEVVVRHGGESDDVGAGDADAFVDRISGLIRATGDTMRVLQGCFENYPHAARFDVLGVRGGASGVGGGSRLSQAAETASLIDVLENHVLRHQRFEIAAYEPYLLTHFHRLFATARSLPDLVFPKSDMQMHMARKESESILRSLAEASSVGARRGMNSSGGEHSISALRMHFVPFLLPIVSPDFRPANIQVLRPPEREMLDRMTDVMTEYGLRLVQRRDADGQYVYALDPPIDSLLVVSQRTVSDFAYPIKQLISSEIALRALRAVSKIEDAKTETKKNIVDDKKQVPVQPKVVLVETTTRDLFGRPVVSNRSGSDESGTENATKNRLDQSRRVVFKFNEGFTNAVRTPIYVRDLI